MSCDNSCGPLVVELLTGAPGLAGGQQGPVGPQGPQGPQGIAGDRYNSTSISTNAISTGSKTFTLSPLGLAFSLSQPIVFSTSAGTMHGTVSSYNALTGVMVASVTLVSGSGSSSTWDVNLDGAVGPKGDSGTVSVGSTTTGAAGSQAAVTNTGTPSAAVLNFTVPAGTAGAPATITVGSTTTGAAGSSANVSNSGTSQNAIINFTIPRGDQGVQGIQGIQGLKGDQGIQGIQGVKGDQGIQGIKGDKGDQGIQGIQGIKGDTGNAATISAGTTTTGDPGTNASVSNSGSSSAATFNFTIPRGATGAQGAQGNAGAAATIAVGTTTTGNPGTSASVSNSGSSSAATFNFTIPRGDVGATGSTGAKGDKGDTGTAATVAVAGTTTGAAGTNASVVNTGTSSAASFQFAIPRGDKGDKGDSGTITLLAGSSVSSFTGDGTTTNFFPLTGYSDTQVGSYMVSVAGIDQRPTTDYTIIGNNTGTVVFASAPPVGAPISVRAFVGSSATNATKLQGRDLSANAPTNGQAICWDSTSMAWSPTTVQGGGGNNDIGGRAWSNTATYTEGDLVATDQNSTWICIQNNNINHDPATSPLWWDLMPANALTIQARAISATAPSNGQVLTWNSSNNQWEPRDIVIPSGTQTFTSSGIFTVPANVRILTIEMVGGKGGTGGAGGDGGNGGDGTNGSDGSSAPSSPGTYSPSGANGISGGNGGNGGDGGDGGDGGTVEVLTPISRTVNGGNGGTKGAKGNGGAGGAGGEGGVGAGPWNYSPEPPYDYPTNPAGLGQAGAIGSNGGTGGSGSEGTDGDIYSETILVVPGTVYQIAINNGNNGQNGESGSGAPNPPSGGNSGSDGNAGNAGAIGATGTVTFTW